MFGAGIVLYELLAMRSLKNFPNGAGILAWAVGMLLILFIPQEQMGIFIVQSDLWSAMRTTVLFVSLFLLCLDSFSNQKHLTARLFTFTPIRYFGNISYSYFLIHGLTLKAFFWVLGKFLPLRISQPSRLLDRDPFRIYTHRHSRPGFVFVGRTPPFNFPRSDAQDHTDPVGRDPPTIINSLRTIVDL